MTVLVTGGSGFLGSHVVERLSRSSTPVRALVRRTSDVGFLDTLPGVERMEGSLDDAGSLRRAVAGVSSVVHVAGLVKARRAADFGRVNADGTRLLLDAVEAAAPNVDRFVYVSSLAAAGPSSDGGPVPVTASAPVTAYGRSKLAAEEIVRERARSLPVCILRPGAIYGPRDREILAFFKAVKFGVLPLTGPPSSKISLVHASDCAAACVAALDASVPSGWTGYVEDGETRTLRELVEAIEQAMNRRVRLRVPIPGILLWSAAVASEVAGRVARRPVMLTRDKLNELRASHWVCSAKETRMALQWLPRVSFPEGARTTADWYRRQGWL